jgi:hypothetical protein
MNARGCAIGMDWRWNGRGPAPAEAIVEYGCSEVATASLIFGCSWMRQTLVIVTTIGMRKVRFNV